MQNKPYDYLIVGAGLFGAVFAREATAAGRHCLVVDKRPHIAGNIYTEEIEGINVHRYGAHIFHTNNKEVWDYVNRFAVFNRYTNSPIANYHGEIYNMPFNMNTFNKMWGVVTPAEAMTKIEEQRAALFTPEPKNLEEQAINLVGVDIYEKLVKGYTEKQWGRPCTELPAFIIRRLPVRFTYDNNYFNALYQGAGRPGGEGGLHRPHRRLFRLLPGRFAVPQRPVRDRGAGHPQLPGQRRRQLHRRRDPLHPRHRAQAL